MSTYGPFHRRGEPGGPGCPVKAIAVQGRTPGGDLVEAFLLDAGEQSTELELLRTVAAQIGVHWGHDDFGWWAAVPRLASPHFAGAISEPAVVNRHALYREDDNGARFLIAEFDTREEAEARAAELAHGGHKQHYFIEAVSSFSE